MPSHTVDPLLDTDCASPSSEGRTISCGSGQDAAKEPAGTLSSRSGSCDPPRRSARPSIMAKRAANTQISKDSLSDGQGIWGEAAQASGPLNAVSTDISSRRYVKNFQVLPHDPPSRRGEVRCYGGSRKRPQNTHAFNMEPTLTAQHVTLSLPHAISFLCHGVHMHLTSCLAHYDRAHKNVEHFQRTLQICNLEEHLGLSSTRLTTLQDGKTPLP